MTFLISTDGPPEEWWSIKSSLTDELIDTATSGSEPLNGVHEALINAGHVHGLSLDEIEPVEMKQALITILLRGAELISAKSDTPQQLKEHYQDLIALLQKIE